MPQRKPAIDRIIYATGRRVGRPIRRLRPGAVVRIEGSGFGKRPSKCKVLFDGVEASPYELSFSPTALLVTVPLPPSSTATVRVRVGDTVSDPIECRLVRPGPSRRPAGSEIRAYYAELDELAAATAALGSALAPATPFDDELKRAASTLDGHRAALQRVTETLGQVAAVHETLEVPPNFQALQGIRKLDETLRASGSVDEIALLRRSLYGPRGAVQTALSGSGAKVDQVLFSGDGGAAAEAMSSKSMGIIGFLLHEASKLIEGVEDVFDLYQPSFALTAEVVVGAAVDVTVDFGGGISAIAKLVDVMGQHFMKVGEMGDAAALDAKIDRQETKLDGLETNLDDLERAVTRLTELVRTQSGKIEGVTTIVERLVTATSQLEEKGDRADAKLDRLEGKQDQAATERSSITELIGIQEGKADGMAVQLGVLEEKLDRQETKADQAEGKLDRLETKADRAEGKLDRLETKADRAEGKLDALETKADRAEGKLDRLETKADRAEEKLDRQEVKLDRLDQPAPLEGAVAAQRGGSKNVTGAVTATDAADNSVNLRAAIDTPPAGLDDEGAWSVWVGFGRPQGAAGILETSIDLSYEDGSDRIISGLLFARDELRNVFHRSLEAQPHSSVIDPLAWGDWQRFLDQP